LPAASPLIGWFAADSCLDFVEIADHVEPFAS
jgi:hypothetical protein